MNEALEENKKEIKIVNVVDYSIDFQIIQNINGSWYYCLQFFPENQKLEVPEIIEDRVKYFTLADAVLIYGKDLFTQWEYAAESAFDAIEALGFCVINETHHFDVFFWDSKNHRRIERKATSDGYEFKLIEVSA